MDDFQRAISNLRSLGIGVTVENYELRQIAKIEGKNISGYFANTEDYATEIKEQVDNIEQLEKRLENAIFDTTHEPVPKRTFPIKMVVSYVGRLPIPPEKD